MLWGDLRNDVVNLVGSKGNWISMHIDVPNEIESYEVYGGNYTRAYTMWGVPSEGVLLGSEVTFNLPQNTYTFFGVWSAEFGGTFVGGGPLEGEFISTGSSLLRFAPKIRAL